MGWGVKRKNKQGNYSNGLPEQGIFWVRSVNRGLLRASQ